MVLAVFYAGAAGDPQRRSTRWQLSSCQYRSHRQRDLCCLRCSLTSYEVTEFCQRCLLIDNVYLPGSHPILPNTSSRGLWCDGCTVSPIAVSSSELNCASQLAIPAPKTQLVHVLQRAPVTVTLKVWGGCSKVGIISWITKLEGKINSFNLKVSDPEIFEPLHLHFGRWTDLWEHRFLFRAWATLMSY